MILTLPFPPSINTYWRNILLKTRKGVVARTLLSKRGREYRVVAVSAIRAQVGRPKIIDHRVKVTITLHPPTLRKYDVDNFNKAILDAITHAKVWLDDELVYQLTISKEVKVKGGRAIVLIERL